MSDLSAKKLNEVFTITPDRLMGDKALARAIRRINKRWLSMSMEDLEFIAKTMAGALRVEIERKQDEPR